MSRDEALKELDNPLYTEAELKKDKEYVLKKLGLTESAFQAIMQNPPRKHEDFKTDTNLKEGYMKFLQRTEKFRRVLKRK